MQKGVLIGHPVQGIKVVLEDGQTHTVDSSDMAFRFAAMSAVKEAILKAGAQVLEPIMSLEVSTHTNCIINNGDNWQHGDVRCTCTIG